MGVPPPLVMLVSMHHDPLEGRIASQPKWGAGRRIAKDRRPPFSASDSRLGDGAPREWEVCERWR